MYNHLHKIIPALIGSLEGDVDQDTWDAAEGVVLSVQVCPVLLEFGHSSFLVDFVPQWKVPWVKKWAALLSCLYDLPYFLIPSFCISSLTSLSLPPSPSFSLSQAEPGPAILIEELVKAAKRENPDTRAAAMGLLQAMCSRSSVDIREHLPHLIIFTTEAFNDPSDLMCERAWLSLEALVKVRAKLSLMRGWSLHVVPYC